VQGGIPRATDGKRLIGTTEANTGMARATHTAAWVARPAGWTAAVITGQTSAGFQSGAWSSATRLSMFAARVTPSREFTSTSSCSMFKVPS